MNRHPAEPARLRSLRSPRRGHVAIAAVASVVVLGAAACGSGEPSAVEVSTEAPAGNAASPPSQTEGEVVRIAVDGSPTVIAVQIPAGWKVRSTERFDEPVRGTEGNDLVVSDSSRIEVVPASGDPTAVLRLMVRTGNLHSDADLAAGAERSAFVADNGPSDGTGRPDSTSSLTQVRDGRTALRTEIVDFDRPNGPPAVFAYAWQETPDVAVDVIGQHIDPAIVDAAASSFTLVTAPTGEAPR